MRSFGMLILGSLLFSTGASADDPATRVGLQELKDKCRELADNPQIQPFSVRVTCREKSQVWKPGASSVFNIANSREVGATLAMKNFMVSYQGGSAQIEPTKAGCMTLDKWEYTVQAVDVELSCAELGTIDNITAYCAPIVDQRVQEDPSIVTKVRTNQVFDTCKGQSVTR